jgi:hypothetical protein
MDPSPFHQKDLDRDAEDFLLSWAQEFPAREPLSLVIHLDKGGDEPEIQKTVEQGIHNYFQYRAEQNRREFGHLMRQGRISLLIGLLFLFSCFLVRELLLALPRGTLTSFAQESVIIAGWVAMWRPMEIYLYEWWPLRSKGMIFRKMSKMPVSVRTHEAGHP